MSDSTPPSLSHSASSTVPSSSSLFLHRTVSLPSVFRSERSDHSNSLLFPSFPRSVSEALSVSLLSEPSLKPFESSILDKILSNEPVQQESKQETNEVTECQRTLICSSCQDELPFSQSDAYYDCGSFHSQHLLCASCFGQWIAQCCQSSVNYPIQCPHSKPLSLLQCSFINCPKFIPESTIQRFLRLPVNTSIEPLYERFIVLNGLNHMLNKAEKEQKTKEQVDAPFICKQCNYYSALIPVNYKEQATQLKLVMMAERDNQSYSSSPLDLTSLFFECEQSSCMSYSCYLCDRYMSKEESKSHSCTSNLATVLYEELLGVLAESSVRVCPTCHQGGMKDENCCNISCSNGHPGITWCYSCRKTHSEYDYYDHFQWSFDSDDQFTCPSMLCQKFNFESKVINDGKFIHDGKTGGEKAVQRFHCLLQKAAVEQWKASYESSSAHRVAIEEMLRIKFPNGIWDKQLEEDLEKFELIRQAWRSQNSQEKKERLAYLVLQLVMEFNLSELLMIVDQDYQVRSNDSQVKNKLCQYKIIEAEWELIKAVFDMRKEQLITYKQIKPEVNYQLSEQEEKQLEERKRNEEKLKEEIQRRMEEISKRQVEEFQRLRALALKRRNIPSGNNNSNGQRGLNAAERRKQRREMERIRLMALRNEQSERVQQVQANRTEGKEREA
jgi:hypothetical protein